jgi:autotransporter-associated beta strand protein
LTIGNANTYTGGTIISNATAHLLLNNYSGLGTGPVTLAMAGGLMEIGQAGSATLGLNGDIVSADDFTIWIDGTGSFAGVFLGNLSGTAGKTLTLIPNPLNTITNDRIRVLGANTTNNANLALNSPLITFASYNTSGSQTYNGVISGGGAFMQKGTITYFNGPNTYSGGTFPVSAAIALGIDSVGFPTVTSGPIGTGPLLLTVDSTTTLTGSGMLLASGGARTIGNPIQYTSGTNNLTLAIGGTNDLTFLGAFTLNGNDLITTNSFTNRTIQVTNTGLTSLSGVISDLTNGVSAGYGFIKTGNGVLALNNVETYTGPTTVSGGTLQVNVSLNAASAVTVSTNATLAGTGTINGPVTVNAGGALAPGRTSTGNLIINNDLTLSGNINARVNRSGFVSGKAVVSGALTNAGTGTVTVTNLGSALQVGDTFTLFNKPLTNGGAMTITGAGMSWQNNLAVDGTISVLGVAVLVPTNSARITSFSLASGNAVINGTNGQSGGTYYLLGSTNVAQPLGQWTAVATNIVSTNGASGAFTFNGTNVVTPNGAQQFYILSNTNNH